MKQGNTEKPVTMLEVAQAAGVSRQTVSFVLNHPDSSRISAPVREKVRETARRLRYTPNVSAKILKGSRSGSVGLICSTPYFGLSSSLTGEFAQLLSNEKYDMLSQRYSPQETGSLSAAIRSLVGKGVDSVVVLDHPSAIDVNEFSVPHLLLSHNNLCFDVGVDNVRGIELAVEHLLGHGRKRIAYLDIQHKPEWQKPVGTSTRPASWLESCRRNGCADPELYFAANDWNGAAGPLIAAMRARKVDAVVAQNDYVGGKLIAALLDHGVRVPDDIAVIGYDGNSFCDFCRVGLATVIQPVAEQVRLGLKLLKQRMDGRILHAAPANIRIAPRLRPAASCGCAGTRIEELYTINSFPSIEMDRRINFHHDIFKSNVPTQ